MPGDTGTNPGEVHWVIGVKDAYRAATGKSDFNSVEARRWFNAHGFSTFKLPEPVDLLAIEREDP
jgi:hypothetical protein